MKMKEKLKWIKDSEGALASFIYIMKERGLETTMYEYDDNFYKVEGSEMIGHIINTGSASFYAKGKMWSVASDNQNYSLICELLTNGCMDEDRLIGLTSPSQAVLTLGGGRVTMDGASLTLDGERLPDAWLKALSLDQKLITALLARIGDRVRVEGDEDAPDGTYVVIAVDNEDPFQRVYLETEDGFFGYPHSLSIKEVHHENG